jgi:hypothetical protein
MHTSYYGCRITPGGCQIGYMDHQDHTGCHQLDVF